MDDPDAKYLHRVPSRELNSYDEGQIETVTATCGKTWSPERPADLTKPLCQECFTRFKRALAA